MAASLNPPVRASRSLLRTDETYLENAPCNSIIIVPCDTFGSWIGYYKGLRPAHPAAFDAYREHIRSAPASSLLGTCLLVLPTDERIQTIACLYINERFSRRIDENTERYMLSALLDLKRQTDQARMTELWHMYRTNTSTMPWEDWKAMIEGLGKEVVLYGDYLGPGDWRRFEAIEDEYHKIPLVEDVYPEKFQPAENLDKIQYRYFRSAARRAHAGRGRGRGGRGRGG